MKRFLSMLAMAVLVLQSVATSLVYAADFADQNEESESVPVVETAVVDDDVDEGSSDEIAADLVEVDDSVVDTENPDLQEAVDEVEDVNEEASAEGETPLVEDSAIVEENPVVVTSNAGTSEQKLGDSKLYPAAEFVGHDGLIQVTASADEGIFPEGTTMVVTPIETSEAESIAKNELGDVVKTAIGVDISFQNVEGEEIEPADAQDVRVSISLINRPFVKKLKEDNLAVIHQDDDGNTESIENVEVEKGYSIAKAEFDHNEFSVFVVAILSPEDEDENAVCTYNFTYSGEALNTQLVKNGEELVDPGIPSLGKNQEFSGWFDGNTKIEFASSVSCTKTTTIEATAKIVNTYYLTFIGSEGEVAGVQKFTVDEGASTEVEFEDVTVVAANNPGEASRVAIGWSKTSDGKTPIEGNTVDVAKVDTLYAIVEEGYRITFNENDGGAGGGASYIGPRSVISGNAASTAKPEDPTRKGYSFDGWYTDPECTNSFNWNNTLTSDITLYAKWNENNNTVYTVIIWKQKVSGEGYDFGESHVGTVATNTEVTDSLYSTYTTKDYEGFSYSGMELDAKTVKNGNKVRAKGDTIINLYYNRDEITLNFYTYDWGRNLYKTMTGLYGQTLKDRGYTRPTNYEWREGSYNGRHLTFLDSFLENEELYAHGTPSGSYSINHYKQNIDDSSYPEQATNSTSSNGGNHTRTFSEKYDGFKVTEYSFDNKKWNSVKAGDDVNYSKNLYIHYTRNNYDLTLMNDDTEYKTIKGIPFEKELSEYETQATNPGDKEGYTFSGWFEDTEGVQKFDWDSTMPAANKVLYAYYEKNEYKVTLHPDGGTLTSGQKAEFNLDYGDIIDKDSLMQTTKDGFELVGWFDDSTNRLYSFGEVTSDVSLTAKWRNPGTVSIVYDTNGGTLNDSWKDNYLYATNSTVKVTGPAEKTDYTFIAWELLDKNGNVVDVYYPNGSFEIISDLIKYEGEDDKNGEVTLKAKYEKTGEIGVSSTPTTITYKANGGVGEDVVVDDITVNQSVKALGSGTFTREGYDFIGWSTNPKATENDNLIAGDHEYIAADNDGIENVLYAIWKVKQYTVKFVDEDEKTVLKDSIEYNYGTLASEINQPEEPTKDSDDTYTYQFAGWNPNIADVTEDVIYVATYKQSGCVTGKHVEGVGTTSDTLNCVDDEDEVNTADKCDAITDPNREYVSGDVQTINYVEKEDGTWGWTEVNCETQCKAGYTENEEGMCVNEEEVNTADKCDAITDPNREYVSGDVQTINYVDGKWTEVNCDTQCKAGYTENEEGMCVNEDEVNTEEVCGELARDSYAYYLNKTQILTYENGEWSEPDCTAVCESNYRPVEENAEGNQETADENENNVDAGQIINYDGVVNGVVRVNNLLTINDETDNNEVTENNANQKVNNFRCEVITNTVTFDPAGGTVAEGVETQVTVVSGDTVKEITTSRSGYTFQGWTLDGQTFDFSTPITGDITLVAQWDKVNNPGGGGGGSSHYSCKGEVPANAVSNNDKEPSNSSTSYSYSTDKDGACTFQCKSGYTRDKDNKKCVKSEQPGGGGDNDEEIELGGQVSDKCSVDGTNRSEEEIAAYLYACENDITTIRDINKARLGDFLTRAEMAKMISVFATKELGMKPNTSKDCSNFANSIASYNQEMKDYMVMSCQLELMGIHTVNYEPIPDFMPSKRVSRAEFGTVLSRVLWGNKYEGTNSNYYVNHLNALKENNIITNINPHITEYRAWVFLMLYRSVEAIKVLKAASNESIEQQVNEELQEEGKAETGLVVEYDSGSVVPDMAIVTESGTLATGSVAEVGTGSVVEAQSGDAVPLTGDDISKEVSAETGSTAETETGSTSD